MKKTFIPVLILLISAALIGLVAIQLYWVKNSIALRDAQFRKNVKIALSDFNHALEKEEASERLKKFKVGQKVLQSIDSLRAARPNAGVILKSDGSSEDSTLYVSPSGDFTFRFKESVHNSRFGQPSTYANAIGNADTFPNNAAAVISDFNSSQTDILTELITNILSLQAEKNFFSKYTHGHLDSLLHNCLEEIGGINAAYEFGVFNVFDQPIVVSNQSESELIAIIEHGYKSRLFPNDLVQDPVYIRVWFPHQDTYLLKTLWPLLFSSTVFMLTVILAFSYTIRTILRQKKVSEIKNDFINNMTHELKTPISTISLACEALSDPIMSSSKVRVDHFVKMISDENKRLGVLVENVLRSAVLDRGEVALNRDKLDMHEIIRTAIHNIELQASQKGGVIRTALNAEMAVIKGDKIHLTNVIYNLLDNAIKYTSHNPEILVITRSSDSCITISVTDNGIGIKKDDQQRIFEKLFRVHTGDVHNIKGFGLGLSYVKIIVEKHHGTISVQSDLGKGSTFTIQLPFDYEL